MINIIKGKIMKYFILTLITLASLFMFASCGVGLFSVTEADKVEKLVAQRYGGLYVFDRKLRDEIIQREKEREEYEKSRLKAIESKKEKLLRDFFTEKEIQDFKDMLARDRKRGAMVDYSHYDVYKKENEILEKLNEKYPNVDEKFPKIFKKSLISCFLIIASPLVSILTVLDLFCRLLNNSTIKLPNISIMQITGYPTPIIPFMKLNSSGRNATIISEINEVKFIPNKPIIPKIIQKALIAFTFSCFRILLILSKLLRTFVK